MNIRHANALSRTLSERKQISIQELGFGGIAPARWVECLGIGEEVLVMVHCPRTHANDGLYRCLSVMGYSTWMAS